MVCGLAFGADVPTEVPAWLEMIMNFVASVPGVGPIFLEVLKYVGVVAAAFTALSTGLTVVAKALQAVGQLLGLVEFAAKVDALYRLVYPYLAYLSIYNAKKKQ